jgi:hypothetical protein
MNPFAENFKVSAHLAGEVCQFPNGRLIRDFGLKDFLENKILEGDDAATIAVAALSYFCADADPSVDVFMFGALTVAAFLNDCLTKRKKQVPQQALKDLVPLLKAKASEAQIRKWITSHF